MGTPHTLFSGEITTKKHNTSMANQICFRNHGRHYNTKDFTIELLAGAAMTNNVIIDNSERQYEAQGLNGPIFFPLATVLPKVQMLKRVDKGKCPKDVAVERLYREYAKASLPKELKKSGIKKEDMHPTYYQYHHLSDLSFPHIYPLYLFDDVKFDTRSVESWLSLTNLDEASVPGVPATAYCPVNQSIVNYDWKMVRVIDYDYDERLWKVISLYDECEYFIPTVQLFFVAEDPLNYIKRLKNAHRLRNRAEVATRALLMIDMCIVFDNRQSSYWAHRKIDQLLSKSNCSIEYKEELRYEVARMHQRLDSAYGIKKFLRLFPDNLPGLKKISIHQVFPKPPPQKCRTLAMDPETRQKRFLGKVRDLNRKSLYYNTAAVEALQSVLVECFEAENVQLFVGSFPKSLPLNDFVYAQMVQNNVAGNYLTKQWPSTLATNIVLVLRPEGKGFLDVTLNEFYIYALCKIKFLLWQVKLRMENAVQNVLENAIEAYMELLTAPCKGFLQVDDEFVWTNDFHETHFDWPQPFFLLYLNINENREVVYSTDCSEFEPTLADLFKKGLERINAIKCINADTMVNLVFDPKLYLRTVELIEDLYLEKVAYLSFCYKKAIRPMESYLEKYQEFVEFYLLNLNQHMMHYAELRKPSSEVKADIIMCRDEVDRLQNCLPDFITIGPFQVNVVTIKSLLITKYDDLQRRIIDYYVDRMLETSESLLEKGQEMFHKIDERPVSIEHLVEIRNFAADLPELLDQYREEIQIMLLEYDVLDYFFINVPDAQFGIKWEVIATPLRIVRRLANLRDEQKADLDEFRRIHDSDCTGFFDRLLSLTEEVQLFTNQFDPNKVMEMNTEVKKTQISINECDVRADILQNRQELLELPPLDFSNIDAIKAAFEPYKIMWNTAADAVKLQDATTGNPMSQIELKDVLKTIHELRAILIGLNKHFMEKPEMLNVIVHFVKFLRSMLPILEAMKFMKNENWLMLHWQELSATTGIDIKYFPTMNFQFLMKKGIMDHLGVVKAIGTRAIEDADEIRKKLEEEERLRQEEARRVWLIKEGRKCRRDIL